MKDTSHLVAIHERLSRLKARAHANPEDLLYAVWVTQAEKELAAELAFLGMPNEPSTTLSDDDLLDALNS